MVLFQFELEALPLKIWPVPEKFSSDVVQVLSFIKVTKEFILLGLLAHEKKSNEALEYFETKMMSQVVANVGIMSSEKALEGLQDLIEKCRFTKGGFRASKDCWKLQDNLDDFYNEHPWYSHDKWI